MAGHGGGDTGCRSSRPSISPSVEVGGILSPAKKCHWHGGAAALGHAAPRKFIHRSLQPPVGPKDLEMHCSSLTLPSPISSQQKPPHGMAGTCRLARLSTGLYHQRCPPGLVSCTGRGGQAQGRWWDGVGRVLG